MKGTYKRSSDSRRAEHSDIFISSHPLFEKCTLYRSGDLGLGVIQQRFNEKLKLSWWGPIDPWLSNDIYEAKGFAEYFLKNAREAENGNYPIVEVRKLMYALHMKPMVKELWETSLNASKVPYLL